jgi:hypothetical protein
LKTIKLNLFELDELSEKARQKALESFADLNLNDDWYQFNLENFSALGVLIGLSIPVKDIYFRGFYSQGDGSGFNATVDLPELFKAIRAADWKVEYPNTGLEFALPPIQPRVLNLIAENKIDVTAGIEKPRSYYGVSAGITDHLPQRRPRYSQIENELDKLETWLQGFAELLNRFLYKSLEQEYDYLTSEEAIVEGIKANEYLFTADGISADKLQQLADNDK